MIEKKWNWSYIIPEALQIKRLEELNREQLWMIIQ
jgi:hypothetical protein